MTWSLTEIRLSLLHDEKGIQIAADLLQRMQTRGKVFFTNDAFLAALLLDVRLNCTGDANSIFTIPQRDRAIVSFTVFNSFVWVFYYLIIEPLEEGLFETCRNSKT